MRRIRTKYGTKVVPDRYAAILTRMKGIEYDDEAEPEPEPEPPTAKRSPPPKPAPEVPPDPVAAPEEGDGYAEDEAPKRRRTYRRRDLTAEE